MIALWLIYFIILCGCIKYYLYKKHLMKYLKNMPTIKEYPIIGSAYRFMGKDSKQIMKTFIEMHKELPITPAHLWFGPQLVILIDKPEDIQAVLNSSDCLDKAHVYKAFHSEFSLFTAETNLWKHDRKLLAPTFNIKILLSYMPIFNDKTSLMVKNMNKELHTNREFDVSDYIFACTLDMICATTLGLNSGVQETNPQYLDSWNKTIEMMGKRMFTIYHHPDFIYKCSNAWKLEKEQLDIAEALAHTIIKEKETKLKENKDKNIIEKLDETDEFDNYVKPQVYIDRLYNLYQHGLIRKEGIFENVHLSIFGGFETTALATSHTMLFLAMYPEIQERVFKEINEVYTTENQYSDYDLLSELTYTEMAIREAMRLFPVAPLLARKCMADTPIVTNDCVIPKSTLIGISVWSVHRSTDIWGPRANEFNPDNFLPERMAKRHPYCYIPFSAGPRNCLGVKYAYLAMKLIVTSLLRKYKFSTELKLEDIEMKFEVTVKLLNKHMVKIEPRHFKNKI